jgi:hypothetical protein
MERTLSADTQAVVEALRTRTNEAGLAQPLCFSPYGDADSLTIQWTAHCILCRVSRRQWIAVSGWGPLRAVRRSFRGPAQTDEAVALIIDCALSAVTVSLQ